MGHPSHSIVIYRQASILNGPSFLKIFVILGGKVKKLISNLQYVKECPTLSQFSEFTQY